MRLVADENIDRPIIDSLRGSGFEVVAIAEVARGSDDEAVLSRSVAEAGILLTSDKDFGDLVFRQHKVSSGVVLIRLSGLSPKARALLVTEAFRNHFTLFPANFTVIEHAGVRVRRALESEGTSSDTR
jgi:predicted nuclease of predicted toxin-antitoxin system